MAAKNCSKCTSAFECSSEKEGCWCDELYVDATTLKTLKEQYDNCLCPVCLKEYSAVSEK
ncbi:MAG: cysteine-rich CWC family protein [Bacteroidota bacterium]